MRMDGDPRVGHASRDGDPRAGHVRMDEDPRVGHVRMDMGSKGEACEDGWGSLSLIYKS